MGEEVDFLDTQCYVEGGKIKYRLFKKPTDSRRYLQRDSYHPSHTFRSVPTSQMIRVSRVNSEDGHRNVDIEELKKDLIKSGYKTKELDEIQEKVMSNTTNTEKTQEVAAPLPNQPIIFSFKYFHQMKELKAVVKGMHSDLDKLIGHHNIMFATRKVSQLAAML